MNKIVNGIINYNKYSSEFIVRLLRIKRFIKLIWKSGYVKKYFLHWIIKNGSDWINSNKEIPNKNHIKYTFFKNLLSKISQKKSCINK